MNENTPPLQTSLYAHLASNGEVFIISDDVAAGTWVDIARFKVELQRLKDTNGFLIFSCDEDNSEEESPQRLLEDLVRSFDIPVRFEEQPHPAVFGYFRSFAKSLWRTVDLANHDVEGTKHRLENAQYWLSQAQEGTSDYSFWSQEIESLTKQLEYVEMAYKKLSDLELELTRDPEGGEN